MEAQRIVGKRANAGRVKGRGRRDSDTLLPNEVPGGQRVRGISKQRKGFLGARVEFAEITVKGLGSHY